MRGGEGEGLCEPHQVSEGFNAEFAVTAPKSNKGDAELIESISKTKLKARCHTS